MALINLLTYTNKNTVLVYEYCFGNLYSDQVIKLLTYTAQSAYSLKCEIFNKKGVVLQF